uniref:Uncharacterized protein n=1 Tax=Amphimedon queenslandica TaxID=400682 RepID=A0A1X7SIT4_AMPQE
MDPAFLDSLKSAGVAQATIEVLENEMVLTSEIFYSLAESHFQQILPKIKVGQHALLLSIWHDNIMSTHTAKYFKVDEIADDSYRSKRSTSTVSVSSECSDIKDLVEVYKTDVVSTFRGIFDPMKGKGIRIKFLPERNPTTFEVEKSDTIYLSSRKLLIYTTESLILQLKI